jgi:hypothetical protein
MGLGKPCAGKPPARFDEGEEIDALKSFHLLSTLLKPPTSSSDCFLLVAALPLCTALRKDPFASRGYSEVGQIAPSFVPELTMEGRPQAPVGDRYVEQR